MDEALQPGHGAARASRGIWYVVLGAALWGIGPVFRTFVLDYLTSTQIVLVEHLILLLFAAPVLWVNRHELKSITWRHLVALLFLSWGGSVTATIMFTDAFVMGNPNAVLLLQKLQPLFAILLARFLLRERLPRGFGLLLVLAVAGTYLLTFGWTLPIGHVREVIGVSSLLALGAAFLWGGSTVMGRLLLNDMKYETVTALRFALGLPLLFVITWSEHPSWDIAGAEWGRLTFYILLQALLPGLLSLLLYYRGLAVTKASYATLAELSFPLVGMLVNWLVFHEVVTVAQVVGFALIWIALFCVARQQE